MSAVVPTEKAALLVALRARLERSERDLARAAIAWLETAGTGDEPEEQKRSRAALGELWRRERLASLHCEVVRYGPNADIRYASVYFLALDQCDPEAVPSFHEWLSERNPKGH